MKRRLVVLVCMVLVSGGCATTGTKQRSGTWYTVCPGDTLGDIAHRFHVTTQEIAEWNNVQNLNRLLPGKRLNIPPAQRSRITKEEFRRADWGKQSAGIKTFHGQFAWPVRGPVHSYFGIRGTRRHDGIDIGAKRGTPILAAADGVVAYTGKLSGYGQLIILRHPDRYYTAYAHNARHFVRTGQRVKKGERIAAVGMTGRTSGPHLHFEIRRGQVARNPLFFLAPRNADEQRIAAREPKAIGPTEGVAARGAAGASAGANNQWRKFVPQHEWNNEINKVFRRRHL